MIRTRRDRTPGARQFSRRQLLERGARGSLGLNLAGLLQAQIALASSEASGRSTAHIRSCIFIFYYGGPSHLDTFDMKPDAPAEVRGEFKPISTSVPGLFVSEHLPRIARIRHKLAVIRGMHHGNRLHDSAAIETFTGRPSPNGDREEFAPIEQFFPCHGSAIGYLRRESQFEVPYASLPWAFHNVVDVPCQGGGFLGKAYDPFQINGDPQTGSYRTEMLLRPADLSLKRVGQRRTLLESLERVMERVPSSSQSSKLQLFYNKAYDLLASDSIRRALDIREEDEQTLQRYRCSADGDRGTGNGAEKAYGRNLRGLNLLIARRLVESGVPFVNVYDFKQQGQNWDSHSDNFKQHKDYLLPPADQAFAALVEDLDERGLLDSTLVVALGEFGRTPLINKNAGRDHWPDCYSAVLAGGGVKGGMVHGASDRMGAFPASDPVRPADLAATIFWRFGLNPASEIRDQTGRLYRLSEGRPVVKLFS